MWLPILLLVACADDSRPDSVEVCGNGIDDDGDGAAIGCGLDGWMDLDDAGLKVVPERWGTVNSAAWLDGGLAVSSCLGGTCGMWVVPSAPGRVDLSVEPEVLTFSGDSLYVAGRDELVYTAWTYGAPTIDMWSLGAWDVPIASIWLPTDTRVQPAPAGDLTGDGIDDLLLYSRGDYTGSWLAPGPITSESVISLGEATALATADLDGDGVDDLVNIGPNLAKIWFGPIAGAALPDAGIDIVADSLALGDTDGDGHPDLLIGSTSLDLSDSGVGATGAALLYATPADPGDPIATFIATDGDGGIQVALPGDVDGDGEADAAIVDRSGAFHAVRIFAGPLVGAYDSSMATASLLTERSGALTHGGLTSPGDVDGDGFADLLVNGQGYSPLVDAWGSAWLAYGGPGF